LIEGDLQVSLGDDEEGSAGRPIDLTGLDRRVGQLSRSVEKACQATSSQLEQSIEDVSRSMPRLAYDIQFMRESALSLHLALTSIHESSGSSVAVDEETANALEQLRFLDSVKKGMEAVREVLKEAENWSTLEPEVTSLLKEGTYDKAAERLAEASKSMVVFQNTAEFETRRTLMTNLQNQLEAVLSAALVSAVNARDITSCRHYHSIFANIQRDSEFRNYYFGARRTKLIETWQTARLSDVSGEQERLDTVPYALKFAELLSRLFADFLALVNEERSYASSIFSEPQTILSAFVQSTLDALSPSLSQRLTGLVEFYGAAALPEVIKTFRHAEDFAISVEKVIDKLGFAALSTPSLQSPTEERPGHSRRLSKRMSISRRTAPNRVSISIPGGVAQTGSSPWEQALFEPFIDLQSEYPTLEKRYLDQSLDSLLASRRLARSDVEARTRALREQALDIITFAEEALSRCTTFTHGYGAYGLVGATDHMFTAFLEHVKSDLLEYSRSTSQRSSTDDYDEFEMSPEDLKAFQLGVNLLGVGKSLRERLLTLETLYRVGFIQFAQTLRGAGGAIQLPGPSLPGTTRGEAELLSQSALNSLQLNTLLDTVDPQGILPGASFLGPGTSTFSSQPLSAARESFAQQQQQFQMVPSVILKGSRLAIKEYARTTQQFLQNVILAPLFQHLSGYPSLTVWTTPDQKKRPAYELAVPVFSLSSTPTVQKLSEGLLALPRMFEVYVGDEEALAFSIETLPFLEMDPGLCELVGSQSTALAQFEASSPSPLSKREGSPSMRRTSLSSPSTFTSPPIAQPPPPPMTAEMVSSAWLSCLALALLSQLTDTILPTIRALSGTGAAQLAYDLGYLSTTVRALNVEWEPLEKWRSYCELSNEEGRKRYLGATGVTAFASTLDEKMELDDILKHVAKIRGWNTAT